VAFVLRQKKSGSWWWWVHRYWPSLKRCRRPTSSLAIWMGCRALLNFSCDAYRWTFWGVECVSGPNAYLCQEERGNNLKTLLGAEDSSVYTYSYNLNARQQQKKRFIIQRWTNKRIPICLHTYLHTHTFIHTYIHAYKILQTLQQNPTKPTPPYIPTLPYIPTIQTPLYYTTNTTLPYTQTTHACTIEKEFKKEYDYIRKWSLLERGGVYCPPENTQHCEVAKQQNWHLKHNEARAKRG